MVLRGGLQLVIVHNARIGSPSEQGGRRYADDLLPCQALSEAVCKSASQIGPLIELTRERLHANPVPHMDASRVQVLKEPGKTAQSQSHMWVSRGVQRKSYILIETAKPNGREPSTGACVGSLRSCHRPLQQLSTGRNENVCTFVFIA